MVEHVARWLGGPGVGAGNHQFRDAAGRFAADAPLYYNAVVSLYENAIVANHAAGAAYAVAAGQGLYDYVVNTTKSVSQSPLKPRGRQQRGKFNRMARTSMRRGGVIGMRRRRSYRPRTYRRKRYGMRPRYRRSYKRRTYRRRRY